jgi:hypothetical protein
MPTKQFFSPSFFAYFFLWVNLYPPSIFFACSREDPEPDQTSTYNTVPDPGGPKTYGSYMTVFISIWESPLLIHVYEKELYISYLSLNYYDGSAYVFQQKGEIISKNKKWQEFSKEKQTK